MKLVPAILVFFEIIFYDTHRFAVADWKSETERNQGCKKP